MKSGDYFALQQLFQNCDLQGKESFLFFFPSQEKPTFPESSSLCLIGTQNFIFLLTTLKCSIPIIICFILPKDSSLLLGLK